MAVAGDTPLNLEGQNEGVEKLELPDREESTAGRGEKVDKRDPPEKEKQTPVEEEMQTPSEEEKQSPPDNLSTEVGTPPEEKQSPPDNLSTEVGTHPEEEQALPDNLSTEVGTPPEEKQALPDNLSTEVGTPPEEKQTPPDNLSTEAGTGNQKEDSQETSSSSQNGAVERLGGGVVENLGGGVVEELGGGVVEELGGGAGERLGGGAVEDLRGVEELPVRATEKTTRERDEEEEQPAPRTSAGCAPPSCADEPEGLRGVEELLDIGVKKTQEIDEKEEQAPLTSAGHVPSSNGSRLMLMGVMGVLLALLVVKLGSDPPPERVAFPRVDIFLKELERTKTRFPGQRPELWRRSRIHLERHLQTARPTEPVSLILTAGRGAETTLRCLARHLASAFSSALNASVLHIDGASKAGQDANQVKLDLDGQLRGAFEGDQPVAVIHRFEELPPSSTIIFYRYCDHENAAYKKVFLAFTVLLAGEEEVPTHLGLGAVEELVDDHLQAKFLSSGHPAAFDRMDLDKFSGLWSRISHLILPVAAEGRMEQQGCGGTS